MIDYIYLYIQFESTRMSKKKVKLVLDKTPLLRPDERSKLMNAVFNGDDKTCKYCNKKYKSSAHLEKHMYLCKMMCDLATEKMTVLEDVPVPRTMYLMLLELAGKYKNLEEKYEMLSKWVVKKKKKINLTDWLNEHMTSPCCSYTSYFDDAFQTTLTDIELLFQSNYHEFFTLMLQKMNLNDVKDCPLLAFNDKSNYIYGYVDDKWCELTKPQISTLLFRCKKTIFASAFELKTLKKDEIAKCEKLEAKFDRLMLKLINAEMSDGGLFNKLRHSLYLCVKKDIKGIVEYDLEF